MTRTIAFVLVLMAGIARGQATQPTTQPTTAPALVAKLNAMPANIWISQDKTVPVTSSNKWHLAPDRIRWCMKAFPRTAKTYGEDTFTGVVTGVAPPLRSQPNYPNSYQTDIIADEQYDVCGKRFQFMVTVYTKDVPSWSKGQTISVTGPTQFWDFMEFTMSASPKEPANSRRHLRVVVHPELGPAYIYVGPYMLRQMSQTP